MTKAAKEGPIAICTHVFSDVDFDVYFNHLWCISHWAQQYELVFVGKKGLQAANARNSMIERCFEKECRYALFLDGDHFIPQQTLSILMESMQYDDCAMVSGVVCKKGEHFQQVCWKVEGEGENQRFYQMTLPLDGRVHEVSVAPFGCTLIDLKKLKKLKKPYFRDTCINKDDDGVPVNIRSDINLCDMFRDNGEKIWVDTRILVGHKGVSSIVYPQSAQHFDKLKAIEVEMTSLREGQVGYYYYPGDRQDG
jgi:hypothetical protein